MTEKRPRRTPKAETERAAPITVTGVRQDALENFAGSIAHVTAIARGECYVSLKERCPSCGAAPGTALDPVQILKLVPRPAEITQANALLAKISLPAQTEDLNLAEGAALIEATLGRYRQSALTYGVPMDEVRKWHEDALSALRGT